MSEPISTFEEIIFHLPLLQFKYSDYFYEVLRRKLYYFMADLLMNGFLPSV